jgi:hypothetical protein
LHQVICDGDTAHGIWQRFRAKHIPHNQIDLGSPCSTLQSRSVAPQASNADTRLQQSGDKPSPDVSADTGQQDEFLVWFGVRRIYGNGCVQFNVQRSTFGIQQRDGVSLCFFKAERELKQ